MVDSKTKSNTGRGYWRLVVPNRMFLFFDLSGVLFWTYAVAELFFVDTDRLLSSILPAEQAWVANLVIVPMLIWLAICAYALRKFVWLYILYVVAFPLVLILWKLPALLWAIGSWNLAIVVFNVVLSAFTGFRTKLLSLCIYAVSVLLILVATERALIALAIICLLASITVSYVRSAINAFRTPSVFALYRKVFGSTSPMTRPQESEAQFGPKGVRVADMPDEQRPTYRDQLQTRLLISKGSSFLARRMEDFHKSQLIVATGLISVGLLLAATLIVFSIAYFGVHRLFPTAIEGIVEASAFDYVLISFSNMLFGELPPARLVEWPALSIAMLQRVLCVSLVGIFLTLLFNVRTKKYEAGLLETIAVIKKAGEEGDAFIVSYYGYASADEAIADLVTLKAAFAKFVIRLRSGGDPA